MKKTLQILLFIGLFLASFLLFLFITFPYEVLKESIAATASQETGFDIRIGDMSASLPLGIDLKNIKVVSPSGGAQVALSEVNVSIGVLGFFLGKVKTYVELVSGAGRIDIGADFGILDLISQQVTPRRVTFDSKNFPLDQLVAFGLNVAANAPNGNPMVQPLLGTIGMTAQLNGKADVALDPKQLSQSTGSAEISLGKAILKLSHPSLGLTDQAFNKALIKAKVDAGTFVVDKSSGFVSEELDVATEGKITLKPDLLSSLLDLKVVLKLDKGMKEKMGFIIDAVTGTATSDGQLTMQMRGPLLQPAVTTF